MKQVKALLIAILVATGAYGISLAQPPKGGGMPAFAVSVKAAPVKVDTVFEKLPVVGSLSANESVEIKSEIEGSVKEVHFEEGQPVHAGDVLIALDASKLNARLAEAQANLEIAQATFTRMSALVESGAVSKQEYDQAQAEVSAKQAQVDLISAQTKDTVIKAPFDGMIGTRFVSLGQVIDNQKVLSVLVDMDPMKVDFHVPERYISRVSIGQTIELQVAAYPDQVFTGEIYFVAPSVDHITRTILVKAKVANPKGQLHSGMFAKLEVVVSKKDNAMIIPEIALIPNAEKVFVFTIDAESKAQMKEVTTGIRMAGMVEIISGLDAKDRVITEGFQKIGPGSLVAIAEENKVPGK